MHGTKFPLYIIAHLPNWYYDYESFVSTQNTTIPILAANPGSHHTSCNTQGNTQHYGIPQLYRNNKP